MWVRVRVGARARVRARARVSARAGRSGLLRLGSLLLLDFASRVSLLPFLGVFPPLVAHCSGWARAGRLRAAALGGGASVDLLDASTAHYILVKREISGQNWPATVRASNNRTELFVVPLTTTKNQVPKPLTGLGVPGPSLEKQRRKNGWPKKRFAKKNQKKKKRYRGSHRLVVMLRHICARCGPRGERPSIFRQRRPR